MKKIVWINSNKMLFESQHKTFNRQCRCITTGNQIGDVVRSSFVRPLSETECNGHEFAPGRLQEYDLGWLLDGLSINTRNWIRNYAKNKSVIAYHFFYRKGGRKINIGDVVTTPEYKLLFKLHRGTTAKAEDALDEATKYITVGKWRLYMRP